MMQNLLVETSICLAIHLSKCITYTYVILKVLSMPNTILILYLILLLRVMLAIVSGIGSEKKNLTFTLHKGSLFYDFVSRSATLFLPGTLIKTIIFDRAWMPCYPHVF
jgi:hypothetical protein